MYKDLCVAISPKIYFIDIKKRKRNIGFNILNNNLIMIEFYRRLWRNLFLLDALISEVSTEQGENGHDIPVRSMTLPVLYKAR
jgi:hypothetical protein